MVRREESDKVGQPKRRIEFSGIGGQISGDDMQGTIHGAWAEVGGERVTEIEVGKKFDIKVQYTASNPNPGLGWLVGLSARESEEVAGRIELYDNIRVYTKDTGAIKTAVLDNPRSPTMPNRIVRFDVQIWGNVHIADYNIPPWQ